MIHIPSGKWSTGALMRVIIPVALELVLFKDVWFLVLVPPVTCVVLTLNLGSAFVLVRPKSWETRIVGIMLGGVAGVIASGAYYVLGRFQGSPYGVIGSFARDYLESLATSQSDPAGNLATFLRLIREHMSAIEAVLVDILGVTLIWAGGRLDNWYRVRWARAREGRRTQSFPREQDPALPSE
jgi:hypothetical protein